MRVAIGIVVAMLLLVAALAVGRSAYLGALDQGALPRDAASSIFDTLVALLRQGGRIVVVAAVLVALVTFLSGLPLRRFAGTAWDAVATSPRRGWVAAHNRVLMGVVGVVAMIVLARGRPADRRDGADRLHRRRRGGRRDRRAGRASADGIAPRG